MRRIWREVSHLAGTSILVKCSLSNQRLRRNGKYCGSSILCEYSGIVPTCVRIWSKQVWSRWWESHISSNSSTSSLWVRRRSSIYEKIWYLLLQLSTDEYVLTEGYRTCVEHNIHGHLRFSILVTLPGVGVYLSPPLPLPLITNTDQTTGLVHILSSGFLLGNISESRCKFLSKDSYHQRWD